MTWARSFAHDSAAGPRPRQPQRRSSATAIYIQADSQPERAVNKVVARFADGRIVKGTTADFVPTKALFHVRVADAPSGTPPEKIHTKELKALFFVKDFAGDPRHVERIEFDPSLPPVGRRISVTFKDGEVLVGTTTGYQPGRPGFFLVPADAGSNVERCWVVAGAAKQIVLL